MKRELFSKRPAWVNAGAVVIFTILLIVAKPIAAATPAMGQKSFASPEEAVHALADAVKNDDQATLATIFGPEAGDLISSGGGRKRPLLPL